ncbi:hypothetical protein [Chania multitudinisentens]|uniref:hypothetical protein n=1 Tax=Chania multitudinisentens TaxID=1639108 RepID=UPI0012B5BB26|nr:hypothetical protein [Chania multitudinisentens]
MDKNAFVSPIPTINFTSMPTGMIARTPSGSTLTVANTNGTLSIITSGTVSFTFSTKNNGAFPTALITHVNGYAYSGGGQTSWAYYWFIPGVTINTCTRYTTPTPPPVPPIEEIIPPEPAFSLKSAVWELDTADVGNVPDVAAAGNSYQASIKNLESNNLCVSYVTKGVKNQRYALGVSNGVIVQGGRRLFMMNGAAGGLLFYKLSLTSNDGVVANNFDFPAAAAKYITLSQAASGVANRSEMCWTPRINLFRNASTNAGMHTDTLNFIITPQA